VNSCYICHADAVSRCYTCGRLICAAHGGDNCHRCNTGIIPGAPRSDQISAEPLRRREANHGWWRPQPAEEFEPPACYACQSLARAVCRHCRSHYCRDHAGRGGLCRQCGQSARLGLVVFLVAIALMAAVVLLGRFVY
jgi:hypothetical protein